MFLFFNVSYAILQFLCYKMSMNTGLTLHTVRVKNGVAEVRFLYPITMGSASSIANVCISCGNN